MSNSRILISFMLSIVLVLQNLYVNNGSIYANDNATVVDSVDTMYDFSYNNTSGSAIEVPETLDSQTYIVEIPPGVRSGRLMFYADRAEPVIEYDEYDEYGIMPMVDTFNVYNLTATSPTTVNAGGTISFTSNVPDLGGAINAVGVYYEYLGPVDYVNRYLITQRIPMGYGTNYTVSCNSGGDYNFAGMASTTSGRDTICSNIIKTSFLKPTLGVSVSETSISMKIGDVRILSTNTIPIDSRILAHSIWSVDDPSIIDINLYVYNHLPDFKTNSVKITALSGGTATIKVTTADGQFSTYCTVYVDDPRKVKSVSINPTEHTMNAGSKYQLTASIDPIDARNPAVTWYSTKPNIANVDANGEVSAYEAGTCDIVVKTVDGDFTSPCRLTVNPDPTKVASVSIIPDNLTLEYRGSARLSAVIEPSTAVNQMVNWSSTNTSVAVVQADGTVTGIGTGTCDIVATTAENGFTGVCSVTVNPQVHPSSIVVNPSQMDILVNERKTVSVNVLPADTYDKTYTWSGGDPSVAVINKSTGEISAIGNGQTTFTATTNDGGKTATCTVTVTTPVNSVKLDNSSKRIILGTTEKLNETVGPSTASNKSVTWSSDDEAVAKVDQNGNVTGISVGKTNIKVTTADGGYTDTCGVDVFIPVDNITMDKGYMDVYPHSETPLSFTITPSDATYQAVEWSSGDNEILTVDENGIVTAKKSGTTYVMVKSTDSGKTSSIVIRVIVPIQEISLSEGYTEMFPYASLPLGVSITPSNATIKDIMWITDNEEVVSVDARGVVKANAIGTATVTATSVEGSHTAQIQIKVITPVDGIYITEPELYVLQGKTERLTAVVYPEDADYKDFTWSSDNPSVATVDQNGNVSGISLGTAHITAMTEENGFSSTAQVHVVNTVDKLNIKVEKNNIFPGETTRVETGIEPEICINGDIEYISSNPQIAYIDEDGLIHGLMPGKTTISAYTKASPITARGERIAEYILTVRQTTTDLLVKNMPESLIINVGDTVLIDVSEEPYGTLSDKIYFESSDSRIATISDYNTVTGISPGTATIKVYTYPNPAIPSEKTVAYCTVTVNTTMTGIKLVPDRLELEISETAQITCEIEPEDSADQSVTWKSSDESVAIVDDEGNVTANAEGVAVVIAEGRNDVKGYAEVVVAPLRVNPTSIHITPLSYEMYEQSVYQLNVTATPENSDITGIHWYSSDDSVATVDKSGMVKAIKAGAVIITAETSTGQVGKAYIKIIPLTEAMLGMPDKLVLIDGSRDSNKTIFVGETLPLNIATVPSGQRNSVTSKSGNTTIVQVSDNMITGVSAGTADVTYSMSKDATAVCHVRVIEMPLTGIYINGYESYSLRIKNDAEVTLNVTTTPPVTSDIVYSRSLNPSIAKVSGNTITAVSIGKTQIEYYSSSGIKAVCDVTVYNGNPVTLYGEASKGGTITPEGMMKAERGSEQTFVCKPDPDYRILAVNIDGMTHAPGLKDVFTYTFTDINKDHTIQVYYQKEPKFYTITATQSGNGFITPAKNVVKQERDSAQYTITPYSGFLIDYLLIDGVYTSISESQRTGTTYTFYDIQRDHSITAVFSTVNYNTPYGYGIYDNGYLYNNGYCVADPVDIVTGAFTWDYRDLFIGGKHNMAFNRYYQSKSTDSGPLGIGWNHQFNYTLAIDGDKAYFGMPDGSGIRFTYDSSDESESETKTYTSNPPGYELTELDHGYIVSKENGSAYHFNGNNQLFQIFENGEPSFTFYYNSKGLPEKITGKFGAYIDLLYDGAGRITRAEDISGNYVTYAYTGDLLTTSTNADGDSMTYEYDDNNRLIKITDFTGTTYLTNAYDTEGRVISQFLLGQEDVGIEYDEANSVNTYTEANGNVTRYYYDDTMTVSKVESTDSYGNNSADNNTYDSNNRITSQTDKLGRTTGYEYDDNGNRTKEIYPDGTYKETVYNSANQIIKETYADGTSITFEHDQNGRITGLTDQSGNTTYMTYDRDGNVTSMLDREGKLTIYEYDDNGFLSKEIDPLGNETVYEHDTVGKLLSKQTPEGRKETYTYTKAGKLLSVTDALGNSISYKHNGNGLVTEETDKLGNIKRTEYNALGKVISETDYEGNITTYAYDTSGNLLGVTDPLGYAMSYEYNTDGSIAAVSDKNGNATSLTYDEAGQITGIDDPNGGHTGFTYDLRGRVTLKALPDYRHTAYTYDSMGRVISETDALGGTTLYTYDERGNVTDITDKNGNTTNYVYNKENRPIRITTPDGKETELKYDVMGRLVSVLDYLNELKQTYDKDGNPTVTTDARGNRTSITYNSLGLMATKTYADGGTETYTYDANGRIMSVTIPDGGVYAYVYDRNGRLISVTMPDGSTNGTEYDPNGNAVKQINADGVATAYSYDGNGNVIKITDPLGNVTEKSYDASNRLISETTAIGETTYTYDLNGNLLTETNPEGGVTRYEYDYLNRKIRETDPNGNVTKYVYDANGNLVNKINPDGGIYQTRYDKMNRPIAEIDPESGIVFYTYDIYGRVSNKQDALGRNTVYEYDQNGNEIKITDPEGNVTEKSYDSMNRLVSEKDPEGRVTQYLYDLMGRIVSKTDAAGGVTGYEYDRVGRVVKLTKPNGGTESYDYDKAGNVISHTDAVGNTTIYNYDANGNVTQVTDAAGNVTRYTYDSMGKPITKTDALGNTITFTYDKNQRIKTVTNERGGVTEYAYDPNGNLIKVTDPEGGETRFEYDPMNRMTKLTGGQEGSFVYSYDQRGLVTAEINATGGIKNYEYDAAGNVVSLKDEEGNTITYEYNANDLLTQIKYENDKRIEYAYNKAGEMLRMSDANGVTEFETDALGRLKSVKDFNNRETRYSYDKSGNRTGIAYPDGSTTAYAYDKADRLISVTDNEEKKTEYRYDNLGNLTGIVYPNGEKKENSYNALSIVVKSVDVGADKKALITSEYSYDATGNVVKETSKGAINTSKTYTYDLANRLIAASDDSGKRTYAYDRARNLIKEVNNDTVSEYVYDLANRLIEKFVQDGKADANSATYTYEYDRRGNLLRELRTGKESTEKLVSSYEYDIFNHMTKGTNEAGDTSAYVYDGLGFRVGNIKTEKGIASKVDYIVDRVTEDRRDLMEYTPDGTVKRNVYGIGKVSETVYNTGIGSFAGNVTENVLSDILKNPNKPKNLTKTYIHQNRIGSTSYVSDENGNVKGYITYDEWGNVTKPTGNATANAPVLPNSYADFTGHPYDAILGKYFADARMYDPMNKRFINQDPGKNGFNWYVYCESNPVNYVDPTGCAVVVAKDYMADRYKLTVQWDAAARQAFVVNSNGVKYFIQGNVATSGLNKDRFMADESAMDHVYNTMMFQVPKPPVNQSSNTGSSSANRNPNSPAPNIDGIPSYEPRNSTTPAASSPTYPNSSYVTGGYYINPAECVVTQSGITTKITNAYDVITGLMYAVDQNVGAGIASELLNVLFYDSPADIKNYTPTSQYDYYLGKCLGDALSLPLSMAAITALPEILTIAKNFVKNGLYGSASLFISKDAVAALGNIYSIAGVASTATAAVASAVGSYPLIATVKNYNNDYAMLEKLSGSGNSVSSGGNLTGEWQNANEAMSDTSRAYQTQITGKTGQVWVEKGVKFDGMRNGRLIEVKGNYSSFVDKTTGEFHDWFTGKEPLIEQANRQIKAAGGNPIDWYFMDEISMNAVKVLFGNDIKGINFILQPLK